MNALDKFRLRKRQQIVVALQIGFMPLKPNPAIVLLREPMALDHGSHRPIEQKDAMLEQVLNVR